MSGVILSTPLIRSLKTQIDDAELHYCTRKELALVLSDNPYIDKYQYSDGAMWQLINQLKREQYKYIIDLENNISTRTIRLFLNKKSFVLDTLRLEKWLIVNLKINKLPNIHIVERQLNTVKSLEIKGDSLGLDFFIPEKDLIDKSWLPESHQNIYAVYCMEGQNVTNRLPFDRMVYICAKINMPIILIGKKEDQESGEKIAKFFKESPKNSALEPGLRKMNKKTDVFNGVGKFSILQFASLIKGAEFVFTHDNIMMHIAASFRKKIFTIWGNTIPLFGEYPYRTKFWIFENKELNCRPCSIKGFSKCPEKHFKCMNDIVFDFYLE